MCWNASVSKNTFIFSTIPLLICLYLKLLPVQDYFVYQSFISMQLIEYFLWTFLNDKKWNRIFSIIGYIFIFLIPFTYIYTTNNKYTNYILAAYILFWVGIQILFPTKFHTSVAPNKHLQWEWLKLPIPVIILWQLFIVIAMLSSFYFEKNKKINIPLTIFATITLIISLYAYYSSNTFGSMWCWNANLFSFYFYFLILNYLFN